MTAKNIFPNLKVTHIFLRENSIAPVIVQFQSLLEDNNISLKFQTPPLISSKPHEIMKKNSDFDASCIRGQNNNFLHRRLKKL